MSNASVTQKEPVYIIIPVHNRKQITLKCLENLQQCGDLQRYHAVVVDDGSTDGTSEAIHALYPEVEILSGDGNLWWTGATKKGMEYAYKQGAEYFIWLNDDTLPSGDAIDKLVEDCRDRPKTILAAQCYTSSDLKVPTYGGQRQGILQHFPVYAWLNESVTCDSLSGNLVCMPRSIVDNVGYPDSYRLPHYQGDSVYTWQAKKAGYELQILGSATAICEKNPGDSSWLTSDISIIDRWKSFLSPKSPFYWRGYWNFCLSCWGIWGILVFLKPYLRLSIISILRWLVPKPLLKRLKHQTLTSKEMSGQRLV